MGSYVVPRLVADGHDVVCVSRGNARPYTAGPAWGSVEMVAIDRGASEAAGDFGSSLLRLGPEVVVDLIGYSRESTERIVDAPVTILLISYIAGRYFAMGYGVTVPTSEDVPRTPSVTMDLVR